MCSRQWRVLFFSLIEKKRNPPGRVVYIDDVYSTYSSWVYSAYIGTQDRKDKPLGRSWFQFLFVRCRGEKKKPGKPERGSRRRWWAKTVKMRRRHGMVVRDTDVNDQDSGRLHVAITGHAIFVPNRSLFPIISVTNRQTYALEYSETVQKKLMQ